MNYLAISFELLLGDDINKRKNLREGKDALTIKKKSKNLILLKNG